MASQAQAQKRGRGRPRREPAEDTPSAEYLRKIAEHKNKTLATLRDKLAADLRGLEERVNSERSHFQRMFDEGVAFAEAEYALKLRILKADEDARKAALAPVLAAEVNMAEEVEEAFIVPDVVSDELDSLAAELARQSTRGSQRESKELKKETAPPLPTRAVAANPTDLQPLYVNRNTPIRFKIQVSPQSPAKTMQPPKAQSDFWLLREAELERQKEALIQKENEKQEREKERQRGAERAKEVQRAKEAERAEKERQKRLDDDFDEKGIALQIEAERRLLEEEEKRMLEEEGNENGSDSGLEIILSDDSEETGRKRKRSPVRVLVKVKKEEAEKRDERQRRKELEEKEKLKKKKPKEKEKEREKEKVQQKRKVQLSRTVKKPITPAQAKKNPKVNLKKPKKERVKSSEDSSSSEPVKAKKKSKKSKSQPFEWTAVQKEVGGKAKRSSFAPVGAENQRGHVWNDGELELIRTKLTPTSDRNDRIRFYQKYKWQQRGITLLALRCKWYDVHYRFAKKPAKTKDDNLRAQKKIKTES